MLARCMILVSRLVSKSPPPPLPPLPPSFPSFPQKERERIQNDDALFQVLYWVWLVYKTKCQNFHVFFWVSILSKSRRFFFSYLFFFWRLRSILTISKKIFFFLLANLPVDPFFLGFLGFFFQIRDPCDRAMWNDLFASRYVVVFFFNKGSNFFFKKRIFFLGFFFWDCWLRLRLRERERRRENFFCSFLWCFVFVPSWRTGRVWGKKKVSLKIVERKKIFVELGRILKCVPFFVFFDIFFVFFFSFLWEQKFYLDYRQRRRARKVTGPGRKNDVFFIFL